MTTILDVNNKLGQNLGSLVEDLTEVATATAVCGLQYELLTAGKQGLENGSNVNGLKVVGTSGTSFRDDGSTKSTPLAVFGDELGTFGDITQTTGGANLVRTMTAATTEASAAAFNDLFSSTLDNKTMFEAGTFASEAIAEESPLLPLGASTVKLMKDAVELLNAKSAKMLKNAKFSESILNDIVQDSALASNVQITELISDLSGRSSIPVTDFKNLRPRTLLRTYEEMEAYLRSCAREVTEVVVHATDTTRDMDVTYDVLYAWDTERGFDEVGYHLIILRDGSLQVCRNVNEIGAHTLKGHNRYSIGIAFVGGILGNRKQTEVIRSAESFTLSQFNTFEAFMRAFYQVIPGGQAWGHNDLDHTRRSDPHFDVKSFVRKKFNKFNVQTVEETRITGALSIDDLIGAQS